MLVMEKNSEINQYNIFISYMKKVKAKGTTKLTWVGSERARNWGSLGFHVHPLSTMQSGMSLK